jgi:hypothetical protein
VTKANQQVGPPPSLHLVFTREYIIDLLDAAEFILQETIGCAFGSSIAPRKITVRHDTRTQDGPWPFAEMCRTGDIVIIDGIQHLLEEVPPRGIPGMRPTTAAILPLLQGEEVIGCFVLCLNPALPYNAEFRVFLDIIHRQISSNASMVMNYENEVQKSASAFYVL